MATKKISELTALTTPVGTEQLVVEEAGGTSKKITAEDLFAGDNVKAKFGDSDDLQIYHDGSNSYVKDAGTGNLRIQAGNLQLTRADGTQNYLTANTGSEVALYHAGSNKLATSSSGVDITGTVRGAVVAYSANQNAPYLIAGTAGYTGATTNWNTYGIQHRIKTNSGGTPRVTIDNYTGEQWSLNASGGMVLTPTGTDGHAIFNEDGIDVDFRVESDNNSHMLFVDGGNDRVQFGSSANIENNRVQVTAPKTLVSGIPQQSLGVNDATAMAEGVGGSIDFAGQYLSDGTYTSFASVEAYKTTGVSGNFDGTLVLKARKHGGDQVDKLRLNHSEAVFNEDGLDTDFRVESDSNTHMLFVDGGNNSVGIGTGTVGNSTLEVLSTGVDGTFANAIGFQYIGNSNEANTISTAVSSNAGKSGFKFNVSDGGGSSGKTSVAKFVRNEVSFNDDSNDQDFRVESDSLTHALF
ncbi:MAG: hypothetical protein GY893_09795, partial [bacterium]|nr:hypothetical protein [bacterium]